MSGQRINGLITGTNFCGPFSSTEGEEKSQLDGLCHDHDRGYGNDYWNYLYYGKADELLRKNVWNSKTKGFRQKYIAKPLAKAIFEAKRLIAPRRQESLGKVMPKYQRTGNGRLQSMSSASRALAVIGSSSRPRKRQQRRPAAAAIAAIPKFNANAKGTPFSGVSVMGKFKRRGKFRKGKSRVGGRSKRNSSRVSKAFVKAFKRAEQAMQPPIRTLRTGYGTVVAGANKYTYFMPEELNMYGATDKAYLQNIAVNAASDYVGWFCKKQILTMDLTNTSNTKVEVQILRVQRRKGRKSSLQDCHTHMATLIDTEAGDQPAAANSVTIADQIQNWDMSQQIGVTTTVSTYWPNGAGTGMRWDTILPTPNMLPSVASQFRVTEYKRIVLNADDAFRVTMGAPYRYYAKGSVGTDVVADVRELTKPDIGWMFRLSTFPHPGKTTSLGVGTPPATVSVVWSRYANVQKVNMVGVVQRPIQYIVNNRITDTTFEQFSDVALVDVDPNAGAD